MSTQQVPLTYEGVLELFRETDRKFQETREQMKEAAEQMAEQMKETREQMKETDKRIERTSYEIGKLTSSVGRIIENMVRGKLIRKFRALGYDVTGCSPNKEFEIEELDIAGEIDLLLDDGPIGILVEVKTTLKTDDIHNHIEKIKEYRRYADVKGFGNKQRFIGAVAGAVVSKETAKFAQKNGMYVIVQSGDAVEIITPPDGFTAKEW